MKRKLTSLILLSCCFLLITFCGIITTIQPQDIDTNDKIAITNGVLINGTGADPIGAAIVLINNGLISYAGSSAIIDIDLSQHHVIDVKGGTILPGFFNTHVHTGYSESNLREWLLGGVTTVRDLGMSLSNFRNNRPESDNSYSRLIAAGPGLTVSGGYPMVPWGSPIDYVVTSPQDGYDKTVELINEGADIIKIFMDSGGAFGQVIPMLSPGEASEIVRAAHERNKLVSAHILVSEDLRSALDAGADDIAHMAIDDIPAELINTMVANNIYWVPTLELWHGVGSSRGLRAIDFLSRFVNAGGKVALGTDYAGYSSEFDLGMPIREIRWMSDAGMSNMDIIVAATKNAAHVCGVDDSLGTLEEGKIADIIVTKGNPLTDLNALTDLSLVIHKGKIIKDNR